MNKALIVAGGLAVALGVATPALARGLGPVPKKVLAAVNYGNNEFALVRHARHKISKRAAITDAIAQTLTPGCPTGISLARTTERLGPPAPRRGTLVWLVTLHPDQSMGAGAVDPYPPPRRPTSGIGANYAFIAVSATTGTAVLQGGGGSPKLPPWTPVTHCAYH